MRPLYSLVLCALLAAAPAVHAATITYTESITASGIFDGTAFTDALVTFSATGDTANVTQPFTDVFISVLPTTIKVAGLHSDSLIDITQFVSNQIIGLAGVGDSTVNLGELFTFNKVFETYTLTSAIGPIYGQSTYAYGHAYPTSGGSFTLYGFKGNSTFEAVTSITPEPSSLLLLATSTLGLAGTLRKRFLMRA